MQTRSTPEAAANSSTRPWLVTGAAGFLGSHVVEHLLSRRVPVVGLDDLSTGRVEFIAPFTRDPLFEFSCVDIRDAARVTELFRRKRPETVVHLAALHFIPAAIREPALTVSLNVHGTQSVLSACRAAEVRRVWYASTADVYRPVETPHVETGEIAPFNIYGLTKLMGEQLVHLEARTDPQRHFVIGRLFNLYGPRETNPHILPEIIGQIRSGAEVLRLGNVSPKRDLVPVADAARAVVEMVEKSVAGVVVSNVGTGVSVSMQEVVERIARLIERPLRIETDPSKLRTVERAHLQADVQRLRAMIGWAPHGDLTRGLRDLLRHEGILG